MVGVSPASVTLQAALYRRNIKLGLAFFVQDRMRVTLGARACRALHTVSAKRILLAYGLPAQQRASQLAVALLGQFVRRILLALRQSHISLHLRHSAAPILSAIRCIITPTNSVVFAVSSQSLHFDILISRTLDWGGLGKGGLTPDMALAMINSLHAQVADLVLMGENLIASAGP